MTRSTCSSVIWSGAPGRGSSARPSSRRATNRDRHLVTVGRDTPSRSATSRLLVPSPQASRIRQRSSSAWLEVRLAVSGRREQEASFFTVIVWRDQAEHAAQSLSKGSRVVVVGRLQQRTWTAEDGSARSTVEVAEELGPSLRWTTARPTRATTSAGE